MTSYTGNEVVVARNVDDEMKESYLRYSMSVIIARALPDVRDGLKPSQRRILYAMRQLSLGPQSKHRKCAKICGDTSGDYHPHGEAVIYPTLVRMAQDWMMRYPLVNGQGNFGSIDGDPPAQMRYTEARMTSATVQLMEDLDKETVDFVPNYDETKKEPTVLPSRFPNLVCNGSSGIAVGMATNIPPHNLVEVVRATILLLDNPKTSIEEMMSVLPGPDFPTGGVICGYRGIKEAYHTGKGKLIIRGVIASEEMPDTVDRLRLVISEIPYNVNKARLVEQIADLVQEKTITGISDIRDESDRNGLRVVVELKKGEMPEVVINQLYKFTDLETTFGCQLLALDKGLPRLMNIKHMIAAWIDHRIEVIRRRCRFELNQAENRAHILAGYLKALDHLEVVIKLIRESGSKDDARIGLVQEFSLSERQAGAILDLRLYQITALERDKITNEHNALLEKIADLKAILASEERIRAIIRQELEESMRHHKSERRTKIIPAEAEVGIEDLIANEEVFITISTDDYIKRMPLDTFREQKRGGQGVSGVELKKDADSIKCLYVASTHDYILIFTSLGRCYWLKVWQIPESGRKSKGKPIINLLEDLKPNEKIAAVLKVSDFDQDSCILLASQQGVVKKSHLSEYSNPRRKGIIAVTIDEGDQLISAQHVYPNQEVMLFTREGMAVRFDESEVRPMGRTARGVRGVSLKSPTDVVVGCEAVYGQETLLVVCENGFGKRSQVDEFRKTHRGGSGVRSIITSDRNGAVVAALVVDDKQSIIMATSSGQTIRIPIRDVRVVGRNTQGVRLASLKDSILVSVQKVTSESEDSLSELSPDSSLKSPEEGNALQSDVSDNQVEHLNESLDNQLLDNESSDLDGSDSDE